VQISGYEHYRILEVARTASASEIRTAHKRLARAYHPDLNPGDKLAEEHFKRVQAAYEVLSNARRRAEYDEQEAAVEAARAAAEAPTPAAPAAPSQPWPVRTAGRKPPRQANASLLREDYQPNSTHSSEAWLKDVAIGLLALAFAFPALKNLNGFAAVDGWFALALSVWFMAGMMMSQYRRAALGQAARIGAVGWLWFSLQLVGGAVAWALFLIVATYLVTLTGIFTGRFVRDRLVTSYGEEDDETELR
jgi:hypothetical protein